MGVDEGWQMCLAVRARIGQACEVARNAADLATGRRLPVEQEAAARAAWAAFLELCTPAFALQVFTAHGEIVARYLAACDTQRRLEAKSAAGHTLSWQEVLDAASAQREATALRATVQMLARVHHVDVAAAEGAAPGGEPADIPHPPPAHAG